MSPATSRPSTRKHWLPGRVTGRVHERDRDRADGHDVAAVVQHEIRLRRAGDALHAARLGPVDVDRRVDALEPEQRGDAFDLPAHERAADVIRVVVGDERADDPHAVRARDLDQLAHAVRRVDDERLAGLAVADEVDEVDHLAGDLVVGREVAAREQLAEVEAVVGHRGIYRCDVGRASTPERRRPGVAWPHDEAHRVPDLPAV